MPTRGGRSYTTIEAHAARLHHEKDWRHTAKLQCFNRLHQSSCSTLFSPSDMLSPTKPIESNSEMRTLLRTVAMEYDFVRQAATAAAIQINETPIIVPSLQSCTLGFSEILLSQSLPEADDAIFVYSSERNNIAKIAVQSIAETLQNFWCTEVLHAVRQKSGLENCEVKKLSQVRESLQEKCMNWSSSFVLKKHGIGKRQNIWCIYGCQSE